MMGHPLQCFLLLAGLGAYTLGRALAWVQAPPTTIVPHVVWSERSWFRVLQPGFSACGTNAAISQLLRLRRA